MNPAIVAALDAFVTEIQRPMLERMDALDAKVQNTLDNVKPILENLNARVDQVLKIGEHESIESLVDRMVEAKMEDYDPCDNYNFQQAVESAVEEAFDNADKSDFVDESDIRDMIRNMTFTVEVN